MPVSPGGWVRRNGANSLFPMSLSELSRIENRRVELGIHPDIRILLGKDIFPGDVKLHTSRDPSWRNSAAAHCSGNPSARIAAAVLFDVAISSKRPQRLTAQVIPSAIGPAPVPGLQWSRIIPGAVRLILEGPLRWRCPSGRGRLSPLLSRERRQCRLNVLPRAVEPRYARG